LTVLAAAGKVQPEVKTATAIRTTAPPRIDGVLDDPEWNRAIAINSFTQYEPDHHQPESQTSFMSAHCSSTVRPTVS